VFVQITPGTRVLQLEPIDNILIAAGATLRLDVQDRALTQRRPVVQAVNIQDAGDVAIATHRGDPLLVSRGTQLGVLWLAPNGAFWRHVDTGTSGSPTTLVSLSATRLPASLTPQ
jgi:hypothetical protein